MKANILYCLLVSAFLFFQCGSEDGDTAQSNASPISAEQVIQYTGSEWKLTAMTVDNQPLPLQADGEVTFMWDEDGKVGGGASVNRYFGKIEFGDDGAITWRDPKFASTMMAGSEPLMQQEQAYLDALAKTSQMLLDGNTLLVRNEDASVSLTFRAAEEGDK